jgi:hypothetical protein
MFIKAGIPAESAGIFTEILPVVFRINTEDE